VSAAPRVGPLAAGWLLAALAFVASLAVLATGIHVAGGRDLPAFDPDEAAKLSDAYYYHLLVERGDTSDPVWSRDFYARTTPMVGKLAFGVALALAGQSVPDLSLQRSFDALWREPGALRREVLDGWLRAGRLASAAFGALATVALALAAATLGGPLAGAAAAALLLGHGVFAQVSRLALTDSLLLFWLAAAPLVLGSALRALASAWSGPLDPRRALSIGGRAVLAPALLVALAAGTKPNGALVGVAYGAALLAAALLDRRGAARGRRLASATLVGGLAAALALALHVASNPGLHEEPLTRLAEGAAVWRDWMLKQQVDPGGALYDTDQKLALAVHATLRSGELPIVRMLGGAGTWLALILLGAGVASLVRRIARAPGDPAALAAAAWALALGLGTALWIPIVRPKYLLPAYLPVCLLQALGAAAIARLAARARASPRDARTAVASGRSATAVATGLAAALLLAPGSPLVDAGLLHPLLVPDSFRGARLAGYQRSAAARPDSAVRRYHLGIAHGLRGRYADGAREFEAALAALPPDPEEAGARVLRADLLLGLARYREALGESEASARALGEHLALIQALRDSMRSRDPFVRAEFDLVLEMRRRAAQPGQASHAQ
jgi:4-amino-4-deoxy-L-arabinose transferase-like glycosyltransferase